MSATVDKLMVRLTRRAKPLKTRDLMVRLGLSNHERVMSLSRFGGLTVRPCYSHLRAS